MKKIGLAATLLLSFFSLSAQDWNTTIERLIQQISSTEVTYAIHNDKYEEIQSLFCSSSDGNPIDGKYTFRVVTNENGELYSTTELTFQFSELSTFLNEYGHDYKGETLYHSHKVRLKSASAKYVEDVVGKDKNFDKRDWFRIKGNGSVYNIVKTMERAKELAEMAAE